MYDLKKMLEESGNKVPPELYQQDAALAPKGVKSESVHDRPRENGSIQNSFEVLTLASAMSCPMQVRWLTSLDAVKLSSWTSRVGSLLHFLHPEELVMWNPLFLSSRPTPCSLYPSSWILCSMVSLSIARTHSLPLCAR